MSNLLYKPPILSISKCMKNRVNPKFNNIEVKKEKKIPEFDKVLEKKVLLMVKLMSPDTFKMSPRYKKGLLVFLMNRGYSLPNRLMSPELVVAITDYVSMMKRKYLDNKLALKYGLLNENNSNEDDALNSYCSNLMQEVSNAENTEEPASNEYTQEVSNAEYIQEVSDDNNGSIAADDEYDNGCSDGEYSDSEEGEVLENSEKSSSMPVSCKKGGNRSIQVTRRNKVDEKKVVFEIGKFYNKFTS